MTYASMRACKIASILNNKDSCIILIIKKTMNFNDINNKIITILHPEIAPVLNV